MSNQTAQDRAKAIVKDFMEHHLNLDPTHLSKEFVDVPYSVWRRTLEYMWRADEMPGYTVEYVKMSKPIYYYVGKKKKFKFDWSFVFNIFKK